MRPWASKIVTGAIPSSRDGSLTVSAELFMMIPPVARRISAPR
jgi:hypothetical protein